MKGIYQFSLSLFCAVGVVGSVNAQGTFSNPSKAAFSKLSVQRTTPVPAVRWHQDAEQVASLGGVANDLCANATVLTVNAAGACPGAAVGGNNGGAGNDNGTPGCDVTESAFEDVWYSFNSGIYASITMDITPGTIEDIVIEVFEGSCAGSVIECDLGALSYNLAVTPGTNYVVRLASNNDFGFGGTFDICLTGNGGGGGSANDDCADVTASPLAIGSTVTFNGDNTDAVPGGDGLLDVGGDTTTVWHAITITECANLTVSFCGTAVPAANNWAALFSNCPADAEYILFSDGNFDDCGDDNLTLFYNDVPAGTYYVPVRGEPATAGPYTLEVSAEACATAGAYCAAGATSSSASFEKISNVNVAGIDNSSTAASGYEDFTAVSGSMTAGQGYPITVTLSNGWESDEVRVWIDFDQNDAFDAGELVFTSTIGEGPHAGTINVPAGALAGSTRMRVRLHDTHDGSEYTNIPNATPCGTSTYGQVEDYTINISGGGPAPVNDLCGSVTAVPLAVGGSVEFTGDNTNATNTGDFVPGSDFDDMDPTVWHAFTTTECANVTVSYCGTDPAFENVWIFLTQDCPVGDNYVIGAWETTTCGPNVVVNYFDLPAGTWYVPVIMDLDAALGAYEITVSATACAEPGPYCEAGATSVQFEKIGNVTFADINNTSTSAAGYEDFTGITGSVVAGVTYPISVTIAGGYATDQVLAWIDWDQSNTFEVGELVLSSANGAGPHTGSVSVPLTALAGTTRMRVRLHDTYTGPDYTNTPNNTPCGESTFGQVEDYTIDMIGIITGMESAQQSGFSVFPNPNDGNMTVRWNAASGQALIEIIDVAGRIVFSEQRAVSSGAALQLGLAGTMAPGTYMLRMTTDKGREEQRIVVR